MRLPITGGAVQGSVLEVMDHNAVMEEIEDEINKPVAKYVESIPIHYQVNTNTLPALLENPDNARSIKASQSEAALEKLG